MFFGRWTIAAAEKSGKRKNSGMEIDVCVTFKPLQDWFLFHASSVDRSAESIKLRPSTWYQDI